MVASIALALAVLTAIAAFAIWYQPPKLIGVWLTLANEFSTANRPDAFSYKSQRLFIWFHQNSRWFMFGKWFYGEWARFDIEATSAGLWLLYTGPEPRKCAECMFIPWSHVVDARRTGNRVMLKIAAQREVDLEIPGNLAAVALKAISA